MHLLHVIGARPNFMKAAPAIRALAAKGVPQKIVHTGQHYDASMSDIFFEQLEMPRPDYNLEVGSGSHAVQTAQIMMRFEKVAMKEQPDLVLVYGDVNSTVAAALVCAKLGIKVGHVEAGLRSFDRSMPEEINRLVTDKLADYLFTPSADGDQHLTGEGIAPDRIFRVGNLMIDTLVRLLPHARRPVIPGLEGDYVLVTLHRPSNVDDSDMLRRIVEALTEIATEIPVLFPVHPRTRRRLAAADSHLPPPISDLPSPNFHLLNPLGYLEFLALQRDARVVITDSGGIQEETTYLGVPCLTVRENTERPITVTIGTNILVGQDLERLKRELGNVLKGKAKKGQIPPLWDGRAGERLAEVIVSLARG